MDFLDSNLHEQVLTALAANLASTSQHDDLALLTASFDSVLPSKHSQVNEVLARVNGGAQEGEGEVILTNDQLESIIATASYVTAAPGDVAAKQRILDLVDQIPHWSSIEPALGPQGSYDVAPADRLAFSLARAALATPPTSAAESEHTALEHVLRVHADLEAQTRDASGHRVIAYVLPALNGLRRAYRESTIPTWPAAAPEPSLAPIDDVATSQLRITFAASEWDNDEDGTESGRAAIVTLEAYENGSQLVISPATNALASLELQQTYWSSLLLSSPTVSSDNEQRWKLLREKEVGGLAEVDAARREDAARVGRQAIGLWLAELTAVEEDRPDLSATELLISSLLSPDLTSILESLLHADAVGVEDALQQAGLESLELLGTRFATFRVQATEIVGRFILSPALHPSDDPTTATPVLIAATRCYHALLGEKETGTAAAVQAILNQLSGFERALIGGASSVDVSDMTSFRNGDSLSQGETASNLVHAVSLLARETKSAAAQRQVGSALQQSALAANQSIACAALCELSELAAVLGKDAADTFREYLRTVVSAAAGCSSSEDGRFQTAISALNRFAEVAANRPERFGTAFLTELLTLHVGKSIALTKIDTKTRLGERLSTLMPLVSVLDTYLTRADFRPTTIISAALGTLFRGFWYAHTLFGFLSPRAPLSEWQRSALLSVARRAPSLVVGLSRDVVEAEAQLNALLKHIGNSVSVEAVRNDLSTGIASQSTRFSSLSPAHVVFLGAMWRLETLRAQAGAFSPLFSYYDVPAFTQEAAGAEIIQSVGDTVHAIFISAISARVPSHQIEAGIYREIQDMLLQTVAVQEVVRSAALRYLDNLLTSFPSLVCDLGVVTVMLELLTVLRHACLDEFTDEYTPSYEFHSKRGAFTITLTDDYPMRNRILRYLHEHVQVWIKTGIARSPLEMQGLLQEYIAHASDGYRMNMLSDDDMGKSVALDLVKFPPPSGKYAMLPAWANWPADCASTFIRTFGAKGYFGGKAVQTDSEELFRKLDRLADRLHKRKLPHNLDDLRDLFYNGAAHAVRSKSPDARILRYVVLLPVRIYTEAALDIGQEVWTWIADARPDLEPRVVSLVLEAWSEALNRRHGLSNQTLSSGSPLDQETKYTPTDKEGLMRDYLLANRVFGPMLSMLNFMQSRFQAFRYRSSRLVLLSIRFVLKSLGRQALWRFVFDREGTRLESATEYSLRSELYNAAFGWFSVKPTFTFGSNRIQLRADLQAIDELLGSVTSDVIGLDATVTSFHDVAFARLPGFALASKQREEHQSRQRLLRILLEDEADRLRLWLNPLLDPKRGLPSAEFQDVEELRRLSRFAWPRWPKVVVHLAERFKLPPLNDEITRLVTTDPVRVQDCPEALGLFVGENLSASARKQIKHLLYWSPVPVPEALRFLFPKFGGDAILLQYALRVLEHHPVSVTFFYVPQVVQALRTDELGYAERFIFETSKISQLFCHQIIWNMKANAYRGDNAEEADPMKPKLDRIVDMIVDSLSGEARDFYNREFDFFDEVTSISGKLKPYIKASKPEKKAKIDEEMAKIKVDPGVYLPSNPDGIVVDINRTSGRPLQSHAKAPFMATFKVRRTRHKAELDDLEAQDKLVDVEEEAGTTKEEEYDTWQSAIFKVGDDCRQDVLALQVIAMHKNIFNSLGLDLLVTPYRVIATGPGCGVIDVVPNATSRDEMGRAKINDLLSFFTMKFGPVESSDFQRARTHFIQSMAAYSLLCYIIQIKDRHNGNIMIDGRGCITHIDFGFLFDIGPGGVKFEPNSFKLSHEMVVLMGGKDSVGFRHFRELTVKAFLAARPHARLIVETVALMLAAEFPSFKGPPTIDRLMQRFRTDLSEKKAAEYMMSVIDNACENARSIVYDEFQYRTNGIPYVR
ncbi:phosphatidylinositol-4- kinase [Rhodotorula mucilaginosa]|uniref:1-phosphatidylinositol 4-kinase n=1 Tax=Rhodotorula mucilaginosa TaxID=5537 RepID=A0A9P7B2L5_RHOMI|nr:phosphatidylinositol-4- kinase [Rhodotorula mucilaginosa]